MPFVFPGNPFSPPSLTVPLVMLLWIPAVLYLFSRMPARKAVVVSFIVAWLYLPQAELPLSGLPDYTKISATCYAVLLATFIYDAGRFSLFRFSWVDIPMAVWCVCPFISSLTNDLGAYDGFSAMLTQVVTWGVPYFLGRIYINSLESFRLLAMGIFLGGLSYVPLCLFEIRFSPQLHRIVYGGAAGADFSQAIRLGGYRPSVFLIHGLAVGAFMVAASLCGFWLWKTGILKRLYGYPISWYVGALFVTFILIKSTGAYILLGVGLLIFFVAKRFRTALPIFIIVAGISTYLYLNAGTDIYVSDQISEAFSTIFPSDRVESLDFRFNNEELLVDQARKRPWFGWAGYGRALVPINDYGGVTTQDSLWIIAFGTTGAVGLISLFTAMLLPALALFALRYPARLWFNPKVAPAAVMTVSVVLYMVDCVLNALVNPLYILAAGGIAGLVTKPREKLKKKPIPAAASADRQPAPQSTALWQSEPQE